MRRPWIPIFISLFIVAAFIPHAISWSRVSLVDKLELALYDARLRLSASSNVDKRIVLVYIDERSLDQEGHWPWSRERLGMLLDQLFDRYQVTVTGFDIVWADQEKGVDTTRRILDQLARKDREMQKLVHRLEQQPDLAQALADKLRGRPVVLGYYFSQTSRIRNGTLPHPLLPSGAFAGHDVYPVAQRGFSANLPDLRESGAVAGHFNPISDKDGVIRRVPVLVEYEGEYYGSLSLAVLSLLASSPSVKPIFRDEPAGGRGYVGSAGLMIGSNVRMPIDRTAAALVPYKRGSQAFLHVSATDVLQGTADPLVLKNSIVLVGASAPGLQDKRFTPLGWYPGVDIHANLIAGALDGAIKQDPDYAAHAEVFLLLAFGIALALALPLLNAVRAALVTLGVVITSLTINMLFWRSGDVLLPLASQLLMIAMLVACNAPYALWMAVRKRHIIALLGQYAPPELCTLRAVSPVVRPVK